MRDLARKVVEWLALDTEEGAAGVEYAVIAGVVIGGLLVWFLRWTTPS
jgi:Flp pilus assembly pilin Flp